MKKKTNSLMISTTTRTAQQHQHNNGVQEAIDEEEDEELDDQPVLVRLHRPMVLEVVEALRDMAEINGRDKWPRSRGSRSLRKSDTR